MRAQDNNTFWLDGNKDPNQDPNFHYVSQCNLPPSNTNPNFYINISPTYCPNKYILSKIIEKAKEFVFTVGNSFGSSIKNFYIKVDDSCPLCVNEKHHIIDCSNSTEALPPSPLPNDYIINICESDASCLTLNNSSYNQIFHIDPDAHNKFPIIDLYNSFYCPSIYSIPLSWNDISQKYLNCACVCKAGYKFDTTTKTCQHIQINSVCDSIIPPKCYQYMYTTNPSLPNGQCSITGSDILIGPLPVPVDSYVELANNINDQTIPPKFHGTPHIELKLHIQVAPTSSLPPTLSNPIFKQSYTWKDYENLQNTLLNTLSFPYAGKYTLHIDAFDYSYKPTQCKIDISVQDGYRPTSGSICPESPSNIVPTPLTPLSDPNLNIYYQWIQNINNDACNNDNRCSNISYTRQLNTIQGNPIIIPITTDGIKTCFDVDQQYVDNLKQQTNNLNLIIENPNVNSETCNIQCSFSYQAAEYTQSYQCNTGTWDPQTCSPGSFCSYENTLVGCSKEFFEINFNIQPNVISAAKDVLPPHITPNPNDIYVPVDCKTFGPECHYSPTLEDLINITMNYNPDWINSFTNYNLEDFIKIRYSIGNEWYIYDKNSLIPIIFTSIKTILTIEAYSACEMITRVEYNIYIHPLRPIDLCLLLEETGIYQASTGKSVTESRPICNYPNTNFAEFTLEFNTNNIPPFQHSTDFVSLNCITCDIKYKLADDTYSDPVTIVPPTQKGILEHYAINLIDNPTTQPLTTVMLSCKIDFNRLNGTAETICHKKFSIRDCDPPKFINKPENDECYAACTDPKPHEACAGKIISFFPSGSNGNAMAVLNNPSQPTCCTGGCTGNSICTPIFDNDLSISKCTPSHGTALSFLKMPSRFMAEYGMMSFMTVGIALAGVIGIMGIATIRLHRRIRNGKPMSEDTYYSPLI